MFLKNNFRPAYAGVCEPDNKARTKKQSSSMMFNSADSDDFNSFSSTSGADRRKAKKPNNKKSFEITPKTIIIAAASVVAVILIVLLASLMLGSGSDGVKYKDNAFVCYQVAEGEPYYVSMNGKQIDESFEGIVSLKAAADNSFAYLVEANSEEGTNVYIIADGKAKLVIEGATRCFDFADFAPGVVYESDGRVRYYHDENDAALKQNTLTDNFAISPDGSKVVYTVLNADKPDTVDVYIYTNEETVSKTLTTGILPIAVSNSGKYILGYSMDINDGAAKRLYVVAENEKFKIEGIKGSFDEIIYENADGTEFLFTATEAVTEGLRQRTYVYNCNEFKKDNKTAYLIGSGKCTPQITDPSIARLETVKDCYFQNIEGERSFYVDDKYSTSSPFNKKVLGQFDPNLKNFYYIDDNDNLCKLPVKDGKTKDYEKIAEDVKSFVVTNKGNIYYIDDDDGLRFYKVSTEKSTSVKTDVDSFSFYEYANELYFERLESMDADTAFQSNEGSESEAVMFDNRKVVVSPKFTNTYSKKTYAYFYDESNNTYSLFYTSNGKTFKFVAECGVINGNYFEDLGDKVEDIIGDIIS